MSVTPAGTWAVVVGIEEYPALPEGWRLPGAGKDAIRFVNWLLARHVPAAQIRLCLSARNEAALLAELTQPVDHRGATREDILTLLDDVSQWNGELLYVFWGGHGAVDSVDQNEPRRLYFANASLISPSGLSLEGLSTMLLRKRTGSILRQALLIDACATFQARARFKVEVAPSSPAYGQAQDPAVRQFQFFASRRGEAAIDRRAEGTGAFSEQLLQALNDAPAGEWPPDLVAVARRVQAAFEDLRTSGRAAQTPIFVGNDWEGSSLFTATPFSDRLRSVGWLGTIVDRLDVSTATLLSLFRASFPDSPKLVDIVSLADVLDFLLDRPALKRGTLGEWPPEAEFAERVRQYFLANGRPEQAELEAWLEDVPLRQVNDLRAALDAEDRETPRYLVIELAPDQATRVLRVASGWLYREGQAHYYRCWTPSDFAEIDSDVDRIRRMLRDTRESRVKQLTIEFVVPEKRLASSPYDWQLDEYDELGARYPVVVRWRNRLADPTTVRDGAWQEHADRLFRALRAKSATRLEWLPAAITDVPEFFRTLEEGELGDLLMAGYLAAGFDNRHPLMFALAGGAPAVAWWTTAVDEAEARQELETLLAAQAPADLAITLFEGRRAKSKSCRAICAATVLFWDHPDRNPYSGKLSRP